jgi:small subunit ribosomal protein S13
MARLAGVDLPGNKRIDIALRSIYGVGRTSAERIVRDSGINPNLKAQELTSDHINALRKAIETGGSVEGDLRRQVQLSIKRLVDLGCYRGTRHRKGLPVRGQRSKTNARTRKGPRKTIANKKK